MAAETALLSSFPLNKSHQATGILRNNRSIHSGRPLTTGTSRHKPENITTSIVRFNRHNNAIPLPVASYYYTTSNFPSLYATFSTDNLRKNSVTLNTSEVKKHVQFRMSPQQSVQLHQGLNGGTNHSPPIYTTSPSESTSGKEAKALLKSTELEKVPSESDITNNRGTLAPGLPEGDTHMKNENQKPNKAASLSKHSVNFRGSENTGQTTNRLKRERTTLFASNSTSGSPVKPSSRTPSSVASNRSTSLINLDRVSSDEMTQRCRKISLSTTLSLSPIVKWNREELSGIFSKDNTTPKRSVSKGELRRRYSTALSPKRSSQSFAVLPAKHYEKKGKEIIDGEIVPRKENNFEKYYSAQLKLSDDMTKHYNRGNIKSHSKRRSNSQNNDGKDMGTSIDSPKADMEKSKDPSSSSVKNDVSLTQQEAKAVSSGSAGKAAKKSNSLESNQATDQAPSTLNVTITTSTVPTISNLAYRNSSWHHTDHNKSPNSDHLHHRPKSVGPLTTQFLTPEQLIIRESVEKVQRWIRTLPKHFDAIHHVLPPVQQDY